MTSGRDTGAIILLLCLLLVPHVFAARLPTVGADNGEWGDLLNEYLLVSLSEDGTLRSGTVIARTIAEQVINASHIASDTITTLQIKDRTIENADLADDSVDSAQIRDGVVDESDLGQNSVSSYHLIDGTIVAEDIADASIGSWHIRDEAINEDHLEFSIITTDHILDDTITNNDIAEEAVQSLQIADGTITAQDMGDSAILAANIAEAAVERTHMTDNAVDSDVIIDGSIQGVDIADATIAGSKLTPNSLDGETLLIDLSVIADKIGEGAITPAKIGAGDFIFDTIFANTIDADAFAIGPEAINVSCSGGCTATATCPAGKSVLYGMASPNSEACAFSPSSCEEFCTVGLTNCSATGADAGVYIVCAKVS